jgi:epoxyqueuosine reductase
MHEIVLDRLAAEGIPGRIVSIRRLRDLQAAIEAQVRQGLIDEQFFQERLTFFQYHPPDDLPDARSLIIVALRDPRVRFTFHWQGQPVPVYVPPTYLNASRKEERVQDLLAEVLGETGHRLAPAQVPEKLLSVCSGLARYGRNNITYVEGMGSYNIPAAFFTDLACEADEWQQPEALDLCDRCTACMRACPTGAIARDRFLLRAERCITFWNEKPPEVAFPAWMDPAWHNCLVGCMHCQLACPENRAVGLVDEQGAEFSEEETGLLLAGTPLAELPLALTRKLAEWDHLYELDLLPRNLKVLLEPSR